MDFGIGYNLHDVATVQFCLDGSQLSVDTGIVGVFTDMAVNLKGKVQSSGTFGQVDGHSLWGEYHDVIVVERSHHVLDEVTLLLMELHILQHCAKLVNPTPHVVLTAFCNHAKLGGTNHTLAADMHLFPAAKVGKELHMERLIAILLRRVDVVDDATRFLVEGIGQTGVDAQCHVLLLLLVLAGVHDLHNMTERDVVEVIARLAHLTPDAVRSTIDDLDRYVDAVVSQHITDLCRESIQTFLLILLVLLNQSGYVLVLIRATIAEAQVLQLNLHIVQSEAICQRSIEEVSLSSNLHLLVRTHTAQCSHIVQTVGKLYQQRTDIIVDGVKHLLVVIHLLGYFVVTSTLLSHYADKEGHIVTETLTNIIHRIVGVFHYIVQ